MVKAILSDLTFDNDGKVDKFIGGESSLPLHKLTGSKPYYLRMFLGGAYEEALGGYHNLFGGLSVVRVSQSDGPHGFAITRAVSGPSSGDVLRIMQHEPEMTFQTLKHRVEEIEIEIGDGVVGITNVIACSFNNMTYLIAGESCSLTECVCGGDVGKEYYYCSDESLSSFDDSVAAGG